MEDARSMGYDAETTPGIKEIEKYGIGRSMSLDDMRTLVLGIRQPEAAGWSPTAL